MRHLQKNWTGRTRHAQGMSNMTWFKEEVLYKNPNSCVVQFCCSFAKSSLYLGSVYIDCGESVCVCV